MKLNPNHTKAAGFVGYLTQSLIVNYPPLLFLTFIKVYDISFSTITALIAISFPRYSKKLINAVNYAKHRGANIIAITDSTMSPIAPQASQLLLARSDMASFVDSLVAPLSIINAIIVAVSRAKQDELTERLRKLEDIWDEYDVYDKNQG